MVGHRCTTLWKWSLAFLVLTSYNHPAVILADANRQDDTTVNDDSLTYSGRRDCPPEPSQVEPSPCIAVSSWESLKYHAEHPAGAEDHVLTFCPFVISRNDTQSDSDQISDQISNEIILLHKKTLRCQTFGKCIIDIPGSQLSIGGHGGNHIIGADGGSDVLLQGLTFRGSTDGAVRVLRGTTSRVTFCHCRFERNLRTNGVHGSALKVEGGTFVSVGYSRFEGNAGTDGAAIFNGGALEVFRSTFVNNVADGRGGAIRSLDTAMLALEDNRFESNQAIEGPAVFADNVADDGGNIARWNTNNVAQSGKYPKQALRGSLNQHVECNGIHDSVTAECAAFRGDLALQLSSVKKLVE